MIDIVIAYPLHDWNEFKVEYASKIRISFLWDKLVGVEVGFKIASEDTIFHLVNYTNGDWRDGEPIHLNHSDARSFSYLRIPAVQINEQEYLVLDGNHRLQEIAPQFCVIDYLIVPSEKKKYITDLYNPYYER